MGFNSIPPTTIWNFPERTFGRDSRKSYSSTITILQYNVQINVVAIVIYSGLLTRPKNNIFPVSLSCIINMNG